MRHETLFINDLAALESIFSVVRSYATGAVLCVFATHQTDKEFGKYCVAVEGPHQMVAELAKLPVFNMD